MVSKIKPQDLGLVIKFGGGLHTRASADEIDAREAADGYNFLLDLDNRELRNRPRFDLVATATNAAEIRGGASLLKSDGSISTLIQAGDVVYNWDGSSGFTQVGNCAATSKLRGHWQSHNWTLDDKVLITDLELADVIKEWDGATFQNVTFTDETEANFGNFYAKYCTVANERAIFANCKDAGATTPHMIVGSAVEDYTIISVAQKPSSALSAADPFYMLTPDLKPINGRCEAFGASIFSSERGQLFNLTGADATDFAFQPFFPGSAASGNESVTYIGTDIIYGRQGRIESVRDTSAFGNSEADDLTADIADRIAGYSGWRIVFNSRTNLVYLFPDNQSEVWVFNPAMRTARQVQQNALGQVVTAPRQSQLSPWMRWVTDHSLAFRPTFVMPLLNPVDGLEYIYMGDASGNIYMMEGTGADGDGGTTDVALSWTSKNFAAPLDAEVYNVEGYIKYKKASAATVTLSFLYAGRAAFDQDITIEMPELSGASYFGGSVYFGGSFYFGTPFSGRLIRQYFRVPGQSSDFQVKITVSGTVDFNINEIGMRFQAAST